MDSRTGPSVGRRLVLSITLTLAAALAAGGAWLARGPAPVPANAPAVAAPPAPPVGGPAEAKAPVRAGVRFSLDEAILELNLVRPSPHRAARDFTASLAGGQRFRLSEHRGKVILVNFWATWCLPCREEMPSMERLWRLHRRGDFLLVAVSLDSDPKLVGPFVAEHGLTFPVALDPEMDVANLYGVRALPASFVVDRQGNLAALALGPRTWDNDAAQALVEGLAR
jgi:peroxiredoxin